MSKARKTRPWIAAAKAEAQANTDRHEAQLRRNWTGRYEDCEACTPSKICGLHAEDRRIPCEGCSRPIEGPSQEWEHDLCTDCEGERPRDFLDYVRARVLCEGEIRSLRAQIKFVRGRAKRAEDRAERWRQLAVAARGNDRRPSEGQGVVLPASEPG